ncbi:MAG: NAD(P)-dependent oxidoreductase, partial [Solirubrobacterales bacterium]
RIAGAALDVFDSEPLEPGNPLLELDNVTLTSHIAGTTTDALTRSPQLLVATLTALLRGETAEIALANPEVLDDPRCEGWLQTSAPLLLGPEANRPEHGT